MPKRKTTLRTRIPLNMDERITIQKRMDEIDMEIYQLQKEYKRLHDKLHPPMVIAVNSRGGARKMYDIAKTD